MGTGSLVCVGTGLKLVAQITLEAKAHIEQADQVRMCREAGEDQQALNDDAPTALAAIASATL